MMSTTCKNSIGRPKPDMPCNTDEEQPVTFSEYMGMNLHTNSNLIWIKSGGLWQKLKGQNDIVLPPWGSVISVLLIFVVCERLAVERLVVCSPDRHVTADLTLSMESASYNVTIDTSDFYKYCLQHLLLSHIQYWEPAVQGNKCFKLFPFSALPIDWSSNNTHAQTTCLTKWYILLFELYWSF